MREINQLAQLIKQSKRITFMTGAGISADSNIPTFRDTNGLWTNNEDLESLISKSYFNYKPKEFWKVYKDIFQIKLMNNYEPNQGHLFITDLQEDEKDITVITQNIDGLHQRSGTGKVFEIHGTLQTATCPKCNASYDLDFINDNDIPRCNKTNSKGTDCNFILKPDVVLFGDQIHHYNEALEAAYESDLFIVMGTSLEVGPVNQIPQYINRTNIPMVLINKEKTKLDYLFDLCIYAGISDVAKAISNGLE